MDATVLILFRDSMKEIKETLLRKTRDSNVLKTTRADGNVKTIEMKWLHTSIYNAIFLQQNTKDVSCKTFADVYNILGDSTLRPVPRHPVGEVIRGHGFGIREGKVRDTQVATVCSVLRPLLRYQRRDRRSAAMVRGGVVETIRGIQLGRFYKPTNCRKKHELIYWPTTTSRTADCCVPSAIANILYKNQYPVVLALKKLI